MQACTFFRRRRSPSDTLRWITLDLRAIRLQPPIPVKDQDLFTIRVIYRPIAGVDQDRPVNDPYLQESSDINDALDAAMAREAIPAFQAAISNGGGQRQIVVITSDPTRFLDLCRSLPSPKLGQLTYECETGLGYLHREILPDGAELNEANNSKVVRAISDSGDDGTSPREITYCFVGNRRSPEVFASALPPHLPYGVRMAQAARQWVFGRKKQLKALEKEFRDRYNLSCRLTGLTLKVTEIAPCDLETINRRTLEFGRVAETFMIDYDGWEAEVVSPTEGSRSSPR